MDGTTVVSATQRLQDPYSSLPRSIGIVDSNAILSSVDNDCRHRRNSRLLRSTLFDCTTLYAADHVYTEVYEKLPKLARSSPIMLEELRGRFEDKYLPAIRFVTVSMPNLLDPQVLAVTDLDDRPTGQLALLTAPVVVFSEDKHLRKPGFASSNWRETAKGAAMVAEAAGEQRVMAIAAALPVAGACWGSDLVGRQLGIPRWVPGAAFAALTGLGVYMFMRGPDRRAAAANAGRKASEALVGILTDQSQRQADGLRAINDAIYPRQGEPSVCQQVALTLARASVPLLAQEVHDLIADRFDEDRVPLVSEIRAVLAEGTEFVLVNRSRWQLGREAGPWRGQYSRAAR